MNARELTVLPSLELARLVDDDALGSRLEDAYGRVVRVLALTIPEREPIIRALDGRLQKLEAAEPNPRDGDVPGTGASRESLAPPTGADTRPTPVTNVKPEQMV